MKRITLLAALLLAVLAPLPVDAQAGPGRPKVGLVLSGGGARGFAHLGLLKVLDELRIPVDVVAGTSMGAVVGGLFAQGMTYAELEAAFRAEDWVGMFHDDPPRPQLPMWRKQQERDIRLAVEVGLGRGGVEIPPSLISGAKLMNALQAHTFRSRNVSRFDDLAIPFRAVATDVDEGSMVVLDGGSLAEAIRASMAVPAAFAPQEIDGRMLVDGGIVRNVPIDAARSMGADVLIVCDVSTTLEETGEPRDAVAVAMRLTTIMTWGSSRDQVATLSQRDVYMRPDLRGVSSSDFSALDAAMAAGERVARDVAAELAALSVPEAEYRAVVAERAARFPAESAFTPSEVRVDTRHTVLDPRTVTSVLRVRAGEPLALPELRDDLVRLMGYGGFQSAEFRVFDDGDARDVLEIRPRDKSWGPLVMRTGLSLRDQQRGAGGWGLRARLGLTRLSSWGGEAWWELETGTRHGLRAWAHHPLGHSDQWFAVADASLGRREVFPTDIFLPLQMDLSDRTFGLGLGARLGTWGEVVAQATAGRFEVELPNPVEGDYLRDRYAERSFELRVEGDRLDRVDFPSSGHWVRLGYRQSGTLLGGEESFKHLIFEAKSAHSTGPHTLTADVLASSGLGTRVPTHRATALGGIQRMTLEPRDGMWAGYSGMARLTWAYRLGAPASDPARSGVRFGLSAEAGQAWETADDVTLSLDAFRYGGSVWLGAETALGPVIVAVAALEGLKWGWVFRLGPAH